MVEKKKRKHNDATNVTQAGVAPTAEMSDDLLASVSGGVQARRR